MVVLSYGSGTKISNLAKTFRKPDIGLTRECLFKTEKNIKLSELVKRPVYREENHFIEKFPEIEKRKITLAH